MNQKGQELFGFMVIMIVFITAMFMTIFFVEPLRVKLEEVNTEAANLQYVSVESERMLDAWKESGWKDLENQYANRLAECEDSLYGSSMLKELETCYDDQYDYRAAVASDIRCGIVLKDGLPCINSNMLRCSELEVLK